MSSQVAAIGAMLMAFPLVLSAASPEYLVYFGTYTGPDSKGIYVSTFDGKTGKVSAPCLAGEVERPSWVVTHPKLPVLYAVSELGNDAKSEGAITSFTIARPGGELKLLNKVSSSGGGACHLAVNTAGTAIFVANYGSGSVAAFRLGADGSIGERTAFVPHQGSSVNNRRQRGPHAHAVTLSPDGRQLIVPDLGTDRYVVYNVSPEGSLAPAPYAEVKPGSGPRHFAFSPSGKFGFGLNEMGSSVTAFRYAVGKGLSAIETSSTLPGDFSGENNSAEIEVDRTGRFVYASNRGHDSITVFEVGKANGKLTEVQRVSTGGKTPRNFKIDPTGEYLLAANQHSNNVVIFRIDKQTGKLTSTGESVQVASPVCVHFIRM